MKIKTTTVSDYENRLQRRKSTTILLYKQIIFGVKL